MKVDSFPAHTAPHSCPADRPSGPHSPNSSSRTRPNSPPASTTSRKPRSSGSTRSSSARTRTAPSYAWFRSPPRKNCSSSTRMSAARSTGSGSCSSTRTASPSSTPGAKTSGCATFNPAEPPANVFDVQIAAGLIGMTYPIGYAGLVHDLLHQRMTKGETLTDWRQRPLTPGAGAVRLRRRAIPAARTPQDHRAAEAAQAARMGARGIRRRGEEGGTGRRDR